MKIAFKNLLFQNKENLWTILMMQKERKQKLKEWKRSKP